MSRQTRDTNALPVIPPIPGQAAPESLCLASSPRIVLKIASTLSTNRPGGVPLPAAMRSALGGLVRRVELGLALRPRVLGPFEPDLWLSDAFLSCFRPA